MTTEATPPEDAPPEPEVPLARRHVSLLSDYGLDDEFVGVVRSVLKALAPGVDVIDITHGIAPFDVRGGGLALARSVQYMCPGVVMALVDPGAGTQRRALAVEVGNGSSVLLGPDNGILAPAVSMVGGATRAVVLDRSEHQLEAPGPGFAGRDVFAPAAAALCRGVDLAELGTDIDPVSLLPGTLPLSRSESDGLHAEVLWVDRFGNVQLNVDPDDIDGMGPTLSVSFHSHTEVAEITASFGELSTGALGMMVDSSGLVSLVANQASAAEQTSLVAGDEVVLAPAEGSRRGSGGEGDAAGGVRVDLAPPRRQGQDGSPSAAGGVPGGPTPDPASPEALP